MENIHKFKKRITATLKRLDGSEEITDNNKKLILDYKRACEKEDLSDARVLFYLSHFKQLKRFYSGDLVLESEPNLALLQKKIHPAEIKLDGIKDTIGCEGHGLAIARQYEDCVLKYKGAKRFFKVVSVRVCETCRKKWVFHKQWEKGEKV